MSEDLMVETEDLDDAQDSYDETVKAVRKRDLIQNDIEATLAKAAPMSGLLVEYRLSKKKIKALLQR